MFFLQKCLSENNKMLLGNFFKKANEKKKKEKSLWTLQQLLTRLINLLLANLEACGLFE